MRLKLTIQQLECININSKLPLRKFDEMATYCQDHVFPSEFWLIFIKLFEFSFKVSCITRISKPTNTVRNAFVSD